MNCVCPTSVMRSFGARNLGRMPLHWTIDPQLRFVSIIAQGDVARSEVDELLDAMASRGAMTYRKLFDGYNGDTAMGPQDLLELGVRMRAYHALGPIGPLALILSDKTAKIILPILGMLAAANRPMRIFQEPQKARRWLESLGGPLSHGVST